MKPTRRTKPIVACALLAGMIPAQVIAANIRYKSNGDYFSTLAAGNVGSNGWQNVSNVPGLPGALDIARFNWANNTVTLAALAPTVAGFQMGVDESGGLEVNNGGTFTATGNSTVGNNAGGAGANLTTGFLTINAGGTVNAGGTLKLGAGASAVAGNLKGLVTINGGTLNVTSHLWVGNNNLTVGTIDINSGGILNITNGILGLGTSNATSASGGIGFLNVNSGGVLNLFNIQSSALGSIQPGSVLDISGSGIVTIPGNFATVMGDYITAGRITGNDLLNNVNVSFDSDLNKTFLTAVPEPGVTALLGSLGLLSLMRRRRN